MSDGEQLAADLAALGTTALAAADALAVPELDVPAPTAPSPALSPAASPDLNAIGIAPDALEAAVVDLPPAEPPSPMSSLSPATPAVTLSPPDGPPEPLSVPSLANGNDNILAVSSKEAATDGASVLPNRAPSPDAPKPIPMARPAVAAPAVPEPAPPYEPLPEDGLPLSDGHVPGEFEPGSSKPESPIVDQLQSVPGMAPEDVATVAAELRAEGRDEPLPPSTTPEAVAAAAREIRDLEAQGLTWPLEKYLGPLHLFRRLVLLLIVVNLVFIAGYFRLSYAAVILIVVAVVPVYRRELNLEEKRIKYRASEEKRLAAMDTGMAESAEWLNFALDRYWQAFEPYLSQQIVDILNESLKKFKPAVLHSIEIEQCTLGTRAPRVTDFRSWSKGGPHILKLQTVLSFIPPTAADRAAYFESRKKAVAAALYEPNTTAEPQTFPPMPAPRECRIVMAVRFGRGNVKIPVLIELSQVLIEEFEAVVTIQLSSQFPHLHSINICVPDASAARRTIDFSLRPLLALDLVSLPVLKDAINSAIDNAIRGALSKPNPTTGDLGVTIRIAKPKDASIADHPEMALGIIRCRLISAVNLRGKGDYRASLKIGGRTVLRTGVQPDNSAPLWDYVEDVPISAMVFANRNERSDEVWIEIEDMDLHHTMHKPLRTRKLRLSQWIDIGKKYASREEVMALPGDSFDRRVVEAWGLPPTMDLLSKKLIDPSNTLKVGAGAEEGDVPQVQMILRWFSIDEVKHEMPELHPNAQTADASVRTGLVTITIHQAMNLKDKTALVPTFEQSSESSGSSGNNSAVGALAKGVTGAVKGAINVVSAGANTVTSLVTGAFEPFVSVVRVNKGAKDWEEQVEVFRTSARLSAAGNPVWNQLAQVLVDDVDQAYFMFKVASAMEISGASIPVGKCVVSLKEALDSTLEPFGSWWPLQGDENGRLRVQFQFTPLKMPPKLFSKSKVGHIVGADMRLWPDVDFYEQPDAATVGADGDGDGDELKPVSRNVSASSLDNETDRDNRATTFVKDMAAHIALSPVALGAVIHEEAKATFSKLENLLHVRKPSQGESPQVSRVLSEIPDAPQAAAAPAADGNASPPASTSSGLSKAEMVKKLMPAGSVTLRVKNARDLKGPEPDQPISSYVKMYGPDRHQILRTDTIKKNANPEFGNGAQMRAELKEGDAPVYTCVVYHDYALRKDPEVGICTVDFRALHADHTRRNTIDQSAPPGKGTISVFETALDLLHPAGPNQARPTGAKIWFQITFKYD